MSLFSDGLIERRSVFAFLLLLTCGTVSIDARVGQATGPDDTDGKKQGDVYSGLQPGEVTQPFKVLRIKDDEPDEVELVKNGEEGVTLVCFVHRLSTDDRILYGLGLVDFYASRFKQLNSHFILLSDEQNKMTTLLRGWSRGPIFKKSLVGLSLDGEEGPGYYGLNRQVDMTVLVIKENKVVDNLVFDAPNNFDLEKIMQSAAKALDQPKPTLTTVQNELKAERQRELDKRIKASRVFKLAPNEELGRIMFGLVNARGNRAKNAERRSQQLVTWAGDSKERKIALAKYCTSVLKADFPLDQFARAAVKKLAVSVDQ
ncbi:MAG: hypothetical protein AAGG48_27905 [Planctomycetota bacterium]